MLVAKTCAAEALSVTVADSATETGISRVGLIESVPVAVSETAETKVWAAEILSVPVAVSAIEAAKVWAAATESDPVADSATSALRYCRNALIVHDEIGPALNIVSQPQVQT